MKNLSTILIALLLFSFQNGIAQVEDIPENAIMIDENTIIKDINGNQVEFKEFMDMMNSGEWTLEPVFKESGEVKYLQMKKATEADRTGIKTMPNPGESSAVIGKKVPDFSMTDLDGNIISLKELKGKVVVLNFWFTSCKPCIEEIPELNKVHQQYASDKEVVFASVTFNKAGEVKQFLEKHPIQYPVVADAKNICDIFEVRGFPTNIVIDRDGNYLDLTSGGFSGIGKHIGNTIEKALNAKSNN